MLSSHATLAEGNREAGVATVEVLAGKQEEMLQLFAEVKRAIEESEGGVMGVDPDMRDSIRNDMDSAVTKWKSRVDAAVRNADRRLVAFGDQLLDQRWEGRLPATARDSNPGWITNFCLLLVVTLIGGLLVQQVKGGSHRHDEWERRRMMLGRA
jgi:hypothetical protein